MRLNECDMVLIELIRFVGDVERWWNYLALLISVRRSNASDNHRYILLWEIVAEIVDGIVKDFARKIR